MKEKLGDPKASRKSYWSILNSFLNNAKKKKYFALVSQATFSYLTLR